MNEIKVAGKQKFMELDIYSVEEFESLPREGDAYTGRIYAASFGERVKIGSSKNVYKRIKSLKSQARYAGVSIGNVVVSGLHTNYRENEKKLHSIFVDKRLEKTELFNMSMNNVVEEIKKLVYEHKEKELKDQTEKAAEFVGAYFFGN